MHNPFNALPDDVLVLVYDFLEDSHHRQAFRHTCAATYKCPVINARIKVMSLLDFTSAHRSPRRSPTTFEEQVRAYPSRAPPPEQLFIWLDGGWPSGIPDSLDLFLEHLATILQDPSVPVHLGNVKQLAIVGHVQCVGSTVRVLASLLPNMSREPGGMCVSPAAGGCYITLDGCYLSATFMDALLRVRCVRGLDLIDCVDSTWDTLLSPIPNYTRNGTLEELGMRHMDMMPGRFTHCLLDYFAGCTGLRKLEVRNEAAGAHVWHLLKRVPVEELQLDYGAYASTPIRGGRSLEVTSALPSVVGYRSELHLSSDSLRVVHLTGRVDRMPRLSKGFLPNLEVVRLYGNVWLPYGQVEFAQTVAGARLELDESFVCIDMSLLHGIPSSLEGDSYDTPDE